jgi:hypothetical protein
MTAIASSFATGFAGVAITQGDDRYDAARVIWNGTVDARPALIARCRTTDDIAAAVNLTRTGGLPLAVRGGGHSAALADTVFRKDWVSQNFTGGPLKAGGTVGGGDDPCSIGEDHLPCLSRGQRVLGRSKT